MSEQENIIGEEISDDPLLGKVVKNYPSDRLRLLIIGGVIYGIAAMILNVAFLPVDAGTASIFVIGGMALFSLVLAWYILHFWNREVVLYENGFSYQQGSHTYYYKFTDISTTHFYAEQIRYFGGLVRRTIKRFTLTADEDEIIIIDQLYRHVDELIARLEQGIYAHLREKMHEQLSNGYDMPFGELLKISSGGLTLNGQPLGWSDFKDYSIGDGQLIINAKSQAGWGSVPIAEMRNAPLLVEYLKERKQG